MSTHKSKLTLNKRKEYGKAKLSWKGMRTALYIDSIIGTASHVYLSLFLYDIIILLGIRLQHKYIGDAFVALDKSKTSELNLYLPKSFKESLVFKNPNIVSNSNFLFLFVVLM
jgi:hypothetical protein